MEEHQLFLCLGGNQGNKSEIFNTTRKLIAENIGTLRNISPVYASPPWGFKAHSAFWNQVLEVSTSLSPEEVLIQIHKIEAGFGRKRIAGKYLSRKMDIDLLFYDSLVMESELLILPHPLLALRRFVLVPLADIAPDRVHPVTGKSVHQMLTETTDPSEVTRVTPPEAAFPGKR